MNLGPRSEILHNIFLKTPGLATDKSVRNLPNFCGVREIDTSGENVKSFEELGRALGRSGDDLVPDTRTETRRKASKGPFADSIAGRELLARLIPVLAANYRKAVSRPPRGLERVLRRLKPEQYALIALRTLLNRVYARRDRKDDLDGLKPPVALRLSLGRILRDELEFAGLLRGDKKYVRARGRPSKEISPKRDTGDGA